MDAYFCEEHQDLRVF